MKVLVAEDDFISRRVLETSLIKWGYEVQSVDNGMAALDALLSKTPPRIALLDWMMPEIDGIEICRIIRKKHVEPYIYIIMITALSHQKYIIEGLKSGADDYVKKPYSPHELEVRIKAGKRIVEFHQELFNLNKELTKLNEQKNEFLGMTAHDLRNPLTVISSISSILLTINNENLNENQILMIELMKKSCETMVMLINDLLDITSIQSGKVHQEIKSHKIEDLLDINKFSSKLIANQKGINLIVDIDENLPELQVDENRVQQIFENLLSNAVKFSHTNTTITLKARKENNSVLISVIDQGQGIPSEDLDKLFKPFEKTSVKPTGKESSTGLGLAIVKKLVEIHNASIDVQSTPDKGSIFTVSFPIK